MSRDGAISEETPLLRPRSPPRTPQTKSTLWTYTLTFGFLAIVSLLVYAIRSSLPIPLSDAAAAAVDGFPGIHAYEEYLSKLTEPHSVNSRQNIAMKKWLDSIALDLQAEAKETGVVVDVITDDQTTLAVSSDWFNDNEHWVVASRNLIVRIRGQSGTDDAILVNAHYDSVPTSYGVTDDGMGVAVEMELLRYFVHHPPQHSMIFLFNNFEEGGLIGAKQFVLHPWFKTVKLFINLEGAGAGGRALLFRCSSLPAAKLLGSASLVHATPLGNDMFQLGLLKSDTDYTILQAAGAPGMDIAFYAPRSHYHTPRDHLNHTTPEALQHMGQMTLSAMRAMDQNNEFFTETHEENLVYYDVLGKFMFAYDFGTHGASNIIALILTPLLALAWTLAVAGDAKAGHLKQRMAVVARGFVATLAAVLFTIVFAAAASAALVNMNPMVTYGNVIAVGIYIFVASILAVTLSQMLCSKSGTMHEVLSSVDASMYGLTTFWWILLIASTYAGTKHVAVLYFAMFAFVGNAAACVIYHAIPAQSRARLSLVFLTQVGLPIAVMVDQTFLVMDSMRHATVDGTPEIAVYALVAFPIVLMALQLQPWINYAGQRGSAALVITTILVLLFAICSVLQPFNSGWSPNKIIFGQEYNVTSGLATVSMTAAAGVPDSLEAALPENEAATIHCEPFKTHQTRCKYQTSLVPIYADRPDEMIVNVLDKSCANGICQVNAQYTAHNSLLCRVKFETPRNDTIIKGWSQGQETEKDKIVGSIITYNLEYNTTVNWGIEYRESNDSLSALVSCFYDEWTKGEIPAFTYLHENLDDSITLLLRGQGLSLVNYQRLIF
ncbi:hypothetical protein BJV82DRAFT_582997 [Fennellomyces sp. T-0311]|nr:hypothetical protein BJV82DRAFT_582997 [Fennellomyces sp. T-0311]